MVEFSSSMIEESDSFESLTAYGRLEFLLQNEQGAQDELHFCNSN